MTDDVVTKIAHVVSDCANELINASRKHAPMSSAHEGYAVIKEELDELWDEIKNRKPNPEKMREEALQVAAMALRLIVDVVDSGVTKGSAA